MNERMERGERRGKEEEYWSGMGRREDRSYDWGRDENRREQNINIEESISIQQ